MRVQTEEWRRFIPGVRMYKGKKTLFYNGEILWEGDGIHGWPLIYDEEKRDSWEVIIILPGVKVIPWGTFSACKNVKTVLMNDSVRKIEISAFEDCISLEFVQLSRNLEYIENEAFYGCESLTSMFIPPFCREIGICAFVGCTELIILVVSNHTQLGDYVIDKTALIRESPFETNKWDGYENTIKSIYDEEEFELHRECASIEPSEDNIYQIIKRQGLSSIHVKNQIGFTAFEYLQKNPFVDSEITEQKLINRLVLDLMGEIIT